MDINPTDPEGIVHLRYDSERPPRVFFDTNVILGLGNKGEVMLRRLKAERGFRFRLSTQNFIELMSHLADPPSLESPNTFRKYQTAFRRINSIFDGILPSAESVLMSGVGLKEFTSKHWVVDGPSFQHQVEVIAKAKTLEDVLEAGIRPNHYKRLREIDAQSFLGLVAEARDTIHDPVTDSEAGSRLIRRLYGYLIFRASSEAIHLEKLSDSQKMAVVEFFDQPGGKMFIHHFMKLVIRMIRDGAKDDGNDFYDMLQLLSLADTNLFFVTEDRRFFQYYAGPEHHRVVRWKLLCNA